MRWAIYTATVMLAGLWVYFQPWPSWMARAGLLAAIGAGWLLVRIVGRGG